MTRLDEPVRPADRREAALLAVKGHERLRCPDCPPEGPCGVEVHEHRRCINCLHEGPCRVEWRALLELDQHPGFHRLRD